METVNCLRCRFRHEDNGNCTAVGGFCTAVAAAHCPLLRDFLDTGLTPDEIRNMSGEWCAAMSVLNGMGSYDRLRELAEADKDGRLVELGLMERPKPVSRKPAPVRRPTPAPAAKPTAEPVAPTDLREGERRDVAAENACNVRDLYDLLGRFIRLGWGAAALTVGGKKVQVPSVCMSCDFQNNLCLDLEGKPR